MGDRARAVGAHANAGVVMNDSSKLKIAAITVGDAATKSHSGTFLISTALLTTLAGFTYGAPATAQVAPGQLPVNPLARHGSVIITSSGTSQAIDQRSPRAFIEWGEFDIGTAATVAISQSGPSVVLNWNLGADPTRIAGLLNSNSTVFLINPNGTIIENTAGLNVGGLLLTSLSIDQFDFMAGNDSFSTNGLAVAVINQGVITAANGSANMLGGAVINQGVIIANSGTINLVAADGADAHPGVVGPENFTITQALQSSVAGSSAAIGNLGILRADGGTITLQASAASGLYTALIQNDGNIEAIDGRISLAASGGGIVNGGQINVGTGQLQISTTGAFTSLGSRPITAGTLSGSISGNASLGGANAIGELGTLDVGGNFLLTNAVDMTQSGPISVSGTTTIDAGSRWISLSNADNDFAGVVNLIGGNVFIRDANSLTLGNIQVSSLMSQASQIRLGSDITTPGLQYYDGAVVLANDVELTSTLGAINFLSAMDGAHVLRVEAPLDVTVGSIGSSAALSGLTINSSRFHVTSTLNVTGNLSIGVTSGGIAQSGAWVVRGDSTFDAGSGSITLAQTGNDFVGAANLKGSSIALTDANDLTIASVSNGANGGVELLAGGTLTLASQNIDTGTADLTLASNGGALTTAGALGGVTISLTGKTGLNVANDVNATGVLKLASDEAIIQSAGTLTASQLAIDGGSASLTSAGNAISTLGNVDLKGDFVLRNSNALSLAADMTADGTVDFFANQGVTVGSGRRISAQATTMHGGLLQVDGQINGSVQINSGATLGGRGIVGSTDIADGGTLAPGALIGTLTVAGDLTLGSGSFLKYELGRPGSAGGGGTSDTVIVAGHLTLDGTLDLVQSSDPADGTAGIGYYRLMTYGTLDDQGLIIGARPVADVDYRVRAGGGNVDLFIGSVADDSLQHWQGGDGTWNAASAQWLNQGGTLPLTWAGNHAVFKNEPGAFDGGTVNVDGVQRFSGLQFVDNGFALAGFGQLETDSAGSEIRVLAGASATIKTGITGAGGIAKTQNGTLVLTGTNSYIGGTDLRGGILSVSSDTNLGATAGGLSFNGGTLATTASFGSNRAITLGATGRLDVAAGAMLGLFGDIAGSGDLIMAGEGTLTLSGANTYGNTLIEDGTLVGHTTSISGSIGNAATVVFNEATNVSFAGNITGLSGTAGRMIKQGNGTLTLKGTSLLDWSVEGGGLVSSTDRFGGNLKIETDGAFTFAQDFAGSYAGSLSGTGELFLAGGGAVRLTGDSSGFSGLTDVSDATLIVNQMLGGSFVIGSGGVLAGSGTIGSGAGSTVRLASGSTLAPGNSIGTLTVNGDLIFDAGSRFSVEVNPDGIESDHVTVTGNAALGGSVAHVGATGEYDLRSTYTILSARTLAGQFGDVTSDFAFLTPHLIYNYGAGTVDLELARNDRDFASGALTRNQITTAGGIESIGFDAGHGVYDTIAQLAADEDVIRGSFDALSGEIHASARTALIEDSRFVRNAANDRIRSAFATAGASYAPVLAYGPGDRPMAVAANHVGLVFWSHGFGSWGSTDSDGNAAGVDRSTGGALVGTDTLIADWRVGVLAGYSHSSFDVADRASSGSSDNYHLGLYGGTQWDDIAVRMAAAYTWHDIKTNRAVSIPGLADILSGNYSAGTFQAFGELGYGIEIGQNTRLEPFANLAHVRLHTDSFAEQGGAAALSAGRGSTGVNFTTLGARGEHGIALGTVDATLRGMIGWRNGFGDMTPDSTRAFSGSDDFSIAGAPIARNSAVIEAGLDLNLTPDAAFGVSYQGQLGSDAQDHGFKANLSARF